MTRMRKAIYVAVAVLAVAGLTLPLTLKGGASSVTTASASRAISTTGSIAIQQEAVVSTGQEPSKAGSDQANAGKISKDVLETLGIRRLPKSKLGKVPGEAAQQITAGAGSHITPLPPGGRFNAPGSSASGIGLPIGLPQVLGTNDALSAALITTIGGRDTQ
ncbi:MAG TPA: hypothetical protein VN687_06120, partial [Blastocatellia bacterium]|nr:hypothetical protein [Blastocatellia bacterium]